MSFSSLFAVGQTVRDCFVHMPDSLLPLLSEVNRADFIDFMDSKMKAEVTNRMGGQSEMTSLTTRRIEIKMTAKSVWQMLLLPAGEDKEIICTVSTVCGTVCDSHVKFFSTDWQELPATEYLLELPQLDSFFKPLPEDASYELRDARASANLLFLGATLNEENNALTFCCNTLDYLDKRAAELLQPYVVPGLVYNWQGGRFVLVR